MAQDPRDTYPETARGPAAWFKRKLRSAQAWEEIRSRLPERLPLPRRLLVARLAVVCAIIVFSTACVIVVWQLGPLRREAMRRAGHEMIFLELRARIAGAALDDDLPALRSEVEWLMNRVDRFVADRRGSSFNSEAVNMAVSALQRAAPLSDRRAELRGLIADLDLLVTALRREEAEVADALDSQFDLLTLLVVGALVLSTVTLLLMERTNRAKEKMAALHYRATHDHLTQGLNRGAIFTVAERELARATRLERALAVVLVDLDKFKEVNDGHGHAAGDAVIRQAAACLRRNVRIYDSVGRYGGDEFLLVLPDADENEVERILERLRLAFLVPVDIGQVMKRISVSLGAAVHHGGEEEIDALIARADRALYQAKAAGRDCWAIDNDAPLAEASDSDPSAVKPKTALPDKGHEAGA